MMNILIIGSGGREHALAHAISKSKLLTKLFVLPGNPGIELLAENILIDVKDYSAIKTFCNEKNIELIIIGPEKPLVDGLGNYLRETGLKVFGPDALAAEIESSKSFAKRLMKKHNIPTAAFAEFSADQYDEANEYLNKSSMPVVLKADGLAAGKGVLICNDLDEAIESLNNFFIKKEFGEAGSRVIIEEFLIGEEVSIFAVTDGEDFLCLPSAQDHKRIGNNDSGKNTGGMGAYCPAPILNRELLKEIEASIIKPTLAALRNAGRKFVGCLYCGLMITETGPKVVEFNCRFGDPETQVVLPLLKGDLLKLLYSAASGKLEKSEVEYSGGTAVCVVAASKGYPDHYEKGFEIKGLGGQENDVIIFHAGTKKEGNKIFTNGGRVLGITAVSNDDDLRKTKEKAYSALKRINFEGMYFRTDIADRGIKRIESNRMADSVQ